MATQEDPHQSQDQLQNIKKQYFVNKITIDEYKFL